ncbi:mgtA regulatory leader peptide MgtL [Lelliottia amnigena]
MDKTRYCASTYSFSLTGGCMDPDPTPLPRGRISFR